VVLTRYIHPEPGQPRSFHWTGLNFTLDPEHGKSWQEFLANRRTVIENNWQKLEPVRIWLAELNAFERIADLDSNPNSSHALDYQVKRPLIQNTMAYASLQALDGQGDAALATLLPLFEVGAKLEAGTRGAQYWRDAREMQEGAIQAAGFVVDRAPVSAEARARFAAALSVRGGGPAGIRRLYAIRHARIEQTTVSFGRAMIAWGWPSFDFLRPELDLMGTVVFNRHASLNRWSELLADVAEFGGRRDATKAQQRMTEFLTRESRVRFKNFGNAWVVSMVARVGLKDVAGEQNKYWAEEDRRAALLRRLQSPEGK
jgi:hypothetical protein